MRRTDLTTIPITIDHPDLAPAYAQSGDAGADLRSAINTELLPGHRLLVPTGVKAAVPEGYALFVHPRSGLALKHGITVLNAPGTVDSGYRGEIGVILHNTSGTTFGIRRGDRIAQAIIQKIETANFQVVEALDATERGDGGFGSTGTE